MLRSSIFLLLPALFFLASCTPSIDSSLDLSKQEIAKIDSSVIRSPHQVSVETFADARSGVPIVVHEGKNSMLRGDAGQWVEKEIQTALANQGYDVTAGAPLILTGAVEKWQGQVKSGLPSEINSVAVLAIELIDPANKIIYRAKYQGFASESHPSLNEEDIKNTLTRAMEEVLSQLVSDQNLIKLLRSF